MKLEELVEEIYQELSRFAGHIIPLQADGDLHAAHECKMVFAESFITRTLKAVGDGDLDEPLGVVGRLNNLDAEVLSRIYHAPSSAQEGGYGFYPAEVKFLHDIGRNEAKSLIALRPPSQHRESGRGKGELHPQDGSLTEWEDLGKQQIQGREQRKEVMYGKGKNTWQRTSC